MSQTSEQIRATMQLDGDILKAMDARPAGIWTYVVANILSREMGHCGITTARVRTRLKVMERWGQVEQTPASDSTGLCWRKVAIPHPEITK